MSDVAAATPWEVYLSDIEREIIRRGSYASEQHLGTRPCLLLIDLQHSVVGDDRSTIEQIDEFPSGVGEAAWAAVRLTQKLIFAARRIGAPVAFTRLVTKQHALGQLGLYGQRIVREELSSGDPGSQILPEVLPEPGDLVLEKSFPSAFFATSLTSYLVQTGIDTIILAGGTTSGCVRATAVDAASLGYRVAVPYDATFDRIAVSHAAALLDIWMKYGIVNSVSDTLDYLDGQAPKGGQG